jgi:hypothetical protein
MKKFKRNGILLNKLKEYYPNGIISPKPLSYKIQGLRSDLQINENLELFKGLMRESTRHESLIFDAPSEAVDYVLDTIKSNLNSSKS